VVESGVLGKAFAAGNDRIHAGTDEIDERGQEHSTGA
jgi:hypothetical protein